MKSIESLLADVPEEKPRALNRKLYAIRRASGFDLCEAAIYAGATPDRLEAFELGRGFLSQAQVRAYASAMKEILCDSNRRLERALERRPLRRVRKVRSPESTAASLKAARAAKAKRRAVKISSVAGAVGEPGQCRFGTDRV